MTLNPTLESWLNACQDAFHDLATTTLGFDDCEGLEMRAGASRGDLSAYIPLFSDQGAYQLGLSLYSDTAHDLACVMLGLDPDEEILPPNDVADAMGEMANILAGGVKARMVEDNPSLKLGLPVFVNGVVAPMDDQDMGVARARAGTIGVELVIMRTERRTSRFTRRRETSAA